MKHIVMVGSILADGLGPPPSALPGWFQVLPPIPCACCYFPRSSRNLKSPAPFFSIGRCPLKQPGINSTPRNNTHSITCLLLTCKTTPILLYPLSPVRRRRISGGNAKQIRSIPVLERNSVLNPVLSSSPSSPSSSSSSASSSSVVGNLLNPESSAAVSGREGRPSHKPRGTDPVLVQFKALQLTGVKESLQSKRKRRLKYFTRLAGQLASEGKLLEFVEFLQMLAEAGIDTTIFTQAVDLDQVDAGLSLILVDGQLDLFVTLMQKLHDVGFAPWRFVGEGARALLSAELRKCLANSKAQRCVQIIHKLTGCGFLAKKLVEPSRVIVACVRTRSVELSYSYVQLLSRNAWHYNAMIREFGYHCELGSAFTVFDLMKKEGVSPDLHTYRALIDACGRSGEPSKAAVVFEGMIKDGIIPNVFVYNSLMNVNVGDMDEVQRLYDHMVVITCTSCSQTAFGSMCDNVPA
jgi:pentatricopeptide repeat protein